MTVNSELNIPDAYTEEECTPTHGKFVISPFESGYGHTIGNALRRVLLSSLEGAAISSVRIEGIDHEFCAVPNVLEDVTEIILNLKKVKLNITSSDPNITLEINKTGEGPVLAGDIETAQKVEILNPELVICNLDGKGASFNAELEVCKGRGWKPAERYTRDGGMPDKIFVDSLFSPVTFVRYQVTKARKGDNTEMDCLTLEIDTDMRITPKKALEDAAMILQNHLRPFLGAKAGVANPASVLNDEDRKLFEKLCKPVDGLDLSVRSTNCLKQKAIRTIGDLCMKSDSFMIGCRNFGRKSLEEVRERLESQGLKLGMEMSEGLKHAIESLNDKSQTTLSSEE